MADLNLDRARPHPVAHGGGSLGESVLIPTSRRITLSFWPRCPWFGSLWAKSIRLHIRRVSVDSALNKGLRVQSTCVAEFKYVQHTLYLGTLYVSFVLHMCACR